MTVSVCRKTYIFFENGVWGVAPMRIVSRQCRCVVQRLCATDFKRPCLVGRQPHTQPRHGCRACMPKGFARTQSQPSIHSLSLGKGVWGFGKDAEIERPKALQDAKPTKRSYRDREQALFLKKTYFFYKLMSRLLFCKRLICFNLNIV